MIKPLSWGFFLLQRDQYQKASSKLKINLKMTGFKRNSYIAFFIRYSSVFLFSSCMLSPKTTRKLLKEAVSKAPYDIIVVPGIPLENGKWDRTMKARVYWSKYLIDEGIAQNVMYSGGAVYSPYIEAEVMAAYAVAIGIPREKIFTETKAEHSTENIYYSYRKARKLNFSHIALATDPFQTKLLRKFVRKKVGKDVDCIPMVFDTLRSMETTMIDPVINFDSLKVSDFKSLPEREGFWKRFKGTRGGNIDKHAYE